MRHTGPPDRRDPARRQIEWHRGRHESVPQRAPRAMTSSRLEDFPMCPQAAGPRSWVIERQEDHSSARNAMGSRDPHVSPVVAQVPFPWLDP